MTRQQGYKLSCYVRVEVRLLSSVSGSIGDELGWVYTQVAAQAFCSTWYKLQGLDSLSLVCGKQISKEAVTGCRTLPSEAKGHFLVLMHFSHIKKQAFFLSQI